MTSSIIEKLCIETRVAKLTLTVKLTANQPAVKGTPHTEAAVFTCVGLFDVVQLYLSPFLCNLFTKKLKAFPCQPDLL